jgi:hypothetical protein
MLFSDEDGKPVRVSKAELLLVAWGDAERIELGRDISELRLTMDGEWLEQRWNRLKDMETAYLLFHAEGYVPVRSEPFRWIGSRGGSFGERVAKTKIMLLMYWIDVIVEEGKDAVLGVYFRKPRDRYLRFVDDEGIPVKDVKVSSYIYWSSSNHCGHLSGADPLGDGVSDSEGRLKIPDGDIEYAFKIDKHHYWLKNPKSPAFPERLVTHLQSDETTVELHRLSKGTLSLRVFENGKPAAGKVLLGTLTACPCGACSGPVDMRNMGNKTDENGRLIIEDFYPEEWESVFFLSEKDDTILWKWMPALLPDKAVISVDVGWSLDK